MDPTGGSDASRTRRAGGSMTRDSIIDAIIIMVAAPFVYFYLCLISISG
jgi:hypothetical protein